MTLTAATNKLTRIQDQIREAQSEIDSLRGQIQTIDDQLSAELAKVNLDQVKVEELEAEREALVKSQGRLTARIEALGKTIPDAEKALNKASLKAAIEQHSKAVDEVNESLKRYAGEGLELLHTFVGMYHLLIDKRLATSDLKDEIFYYTELLGLKRPELKTANSLTDQEDKQLADAIKACIPMRSEIDPWRSSPFKAKLNELNAEKLEKKRAIAIEKNKVEAALAG